MALGVAALVVACGARTELRRPRAPRPDPWAPRLIWPISTSNVSTQRPTLEWRAATWTPGARVELSTDRRFDAVVRRFDVTGTHLRVAPALTPGVWFWRVRAVAPTGDDRHVSAIWQFRVPVRDTSTDTIVSFHTDLNGDGFPELLISAIAEPGDIELLVHYGSRQGFRDGGAIPRGVGAFRGWPLADVNGDGYGDHVVGIDGVLRIVPGGPAGLDLEESLGDWPLMSLLPAGDVDRDGYGDVVAITQNGRPQVDIYRGGPGGPARVPAWTYQREDLPDDPNTAVSCLIGAFDFDGDRHLDLAVPWSDGLLEVLYGPLTSPPPRRLRLRTTWMPNAQCHIGDFNGDGLGDVAIVQFITRGLPILLSGPRPHLVELSAPPFTDPYGNPVTTPGFVPSDYLLTSAGDVNADGFEDILFFPSHGIQFRPFGIPIHAGSPDGPSRTPTWILRDTTGSTGWGSGAASCGDLDGDGNAEILVLDYTWPLRPSGVRVHAGSPRGPSLVPRQIFYPRAGGRRGPAILAPCHR